MQKPVPGTGHAPTGRGRSRPVCLRNPAPGTRPWAYGTARFETRLPALSGRSHLGPSLAWESNTPFELAAGCEGLDATNRCQAPGHGPPRRARSWPVCSALAGAWFVPSSVAEGETPSSSRTAPSAPARRVVRPRDSELSRLSAKAGFASALSRNGDASVGRGRSAPRRARGPLSTRAAP